jgi:succinate dehydrogenase / fumarate reductase iron-sulfur subunit
MKQFFDQLEKVKPYLITNSDNPEIERTQSPEEREELDGLYECILCGCCSLNFRVITISYQVRLYLF